MGIFDVFRVSGVLQLLQVPILNFSSRVTCKVSIVWDFFSVFTESTHAATILQCLFCHRFLCGTGCWVALLHAFDSFDEPGPLNGNHQMYH